MAIREKQNLDEWRFRGELMCIYATHYDSIDVARQMGVLPPVGSRAERLLAAFQPLQARLQRRRAGLG